MIPQVPDRGGEFLAGAKTIFPVLIAVVVYGLLFGTLAAQKGLSPLEVALMSATVFAGASQFVAVEIWSAPPLVLLLTGTALMVNLRHVLMGAALAPQLRGWRPLQTYGGLFLMADENWAFALQRSRRTRLTPAYYFGLSLPLYFGWISTTTLGAVFGRALQNPERYALDFAFTAVFLTLLVGLWRGRSSALPWLASAVVAVAAYRYLPGVWYIALGGVAGTLAGAFQGGQPQPLTETGDAA